MMNVVERVQNGLPRESPQEFLDRQLNQPPKHVADEYIAHMNERWAAGQPVERAQDFFARRMQEIQQTPARKEA